ncbi:hypothetical protein Cni_G07224 [Canna indica]|uniref:Uncharacterized protein n=1 Tax=Canna indica TaxID=4628 RepID=A0AAQ3Q762_9LILI|nr:hypothetical protein Cni_G07224 [Canna indica]
MLDHALSYIIELKERVEKLKQKKLETRSGPPGLVIAAAAANSSLQPQVMIRSAVSNLEINVVCGSRARISMLREVIVLLEEEGADIISASFHSVGDTSFHTIVCQAISPRIGFDASRVHHRMKELVGQRCCIQELALHQKLAP